ncbi:MAG: hypothetical protein E4H25_02880 [Methanomassiliicoccus sp.]|nr:MAG: hypothetical protein E4H25_02880 [Methanomassiliicoccus sp.]
MLMARGRLEFLDKEEIARIHGISLRLLDEVGILVHSRQVSEMLEKAGARRSDDGKRLLLDERMVMSAVSDAKRPVILASRDGKNDISIPSPDRMYVTNGGEGVFVKNLVTEESRSATSDDLRDFAILVNELPQVDFFWPMVGALEQPVRLKGITEHKVSMMHTTKHIQAMATGTEEARWMIEMASIFTGGEEALAERPIFSAVECPISPLTFEKGLVEGQVELSRGGIPIVAMAASVTGLSSPVTISGTLTQVNAENLASLVISQAAKNGSPFIYSTDSSPADLKTGSIDYGALEVPLIRVGAGQMGRSYGLPTMVIGVGLENLAHGMSNVWEGVPHISIQSMVPSDLASGFGGIDMATGASFEQLVADAWVWDVAKESAREFDTDDDAISFDTIRDATKDGNFIGKRHTMARFRKEIISSTRPEASIEHRMREDKRGSLIRRASEEVKRILSKPKTPLVTEEELSKLDGFFRKIQNS